MKYQLIEKNKEYIVINKPAGLLTHGAPHIKEPSLVDQILTDFPDIAKVGEDPERPGIMHRLDKLASGLLVIARNMDSFDNLKSQFQNRSIDKTYTALVYGQIEGEGERITFPIKRSTKGYKMAALPNTNKGEVNIDGRRAITDFWIEQKYINYTLLKVKIKTGRTHQIRVHMSAYGHPVVGDDLYGTKKTRIKNRKLELDRLFLVAKKLEFLNLLIANRRKKIFGTHQDGKALTLEQIKTFYKKDNVLDVSKSLIKKGYLSNYDNKHNPVCGNMSFEVFKFLDPESISITLTASDTNRLGIVQSGKARRLTPRECARLQGFPDSYKLLENDTAVYKQMGNAVSVPVIEAVISDLR